LVRCSWGAGEPAAEHDKVSVPLCARRTLFVLLHMEHLDSLVCCFGGRGQRGSRVGGLGCKRASTECLSLYAVFSTWNVLIPAGAVLQAANSVAPGLGVWDAKGPRQSVCPFMPWGGEADPVGLRMPQTVCRGEGLGAKHGLHRVSVPLCRLLHVERLDSRGRCFAGRGQRGSRVGGLGCKTASTECLSLYALGG